ncbi:MAG: hypothetical protein FWD61_15320 [Phycisphaerales bacterium]|nr:hypothetical protein [Phycisphaerales bacterium]
MTIHIRRNARAILAAAILTLATATAARAAAPAVLDQIPSDAKVAIVVNNLKTLSTKLSNAATQLNLPLPPDPDPIGSALQRTGFTKGIDANSSAAFVLVQTAAEPKENEIAPPPMVILMPTTDPKAMLENFQPGEPDKDGIFEVTPPGSSKGYALTVDKWVALSPDHEALTAYLKRKGSLTKSLPEDSLKVFEANDLVVWANIPAVEPSWTKQLEDIQTMVVSRMDLLSMNKATPELSMALAKGMLKESFLAAGQYIKDAQSAMFTLRLSDAGLTLGTVGSFKHNTPMGNFLAAQKNAKPLTLQGLPAGDFLVAGFVAWDGKTNSIVLADAIKRVTSDEAFTKAAKPDDIAKFTELNHQLVSMTSGMSIVLLDKGLTNGIMHGATIIETSDPAKYIAIVTELYNNNSVLKAIGSGNPDIIQETTVSPTPTTIKNIKFTRVNIKWKLREATADKPLTPGSQEAYAMITKLYGESISMYMGEVGKRVLGIYGSDPAELEAAVVAAQTNSSNLANHASIIASKNQVVPNPIGVFYLSVSRLVDLAQTIKTDAPAAGGGGGAGGNATPPLVGSAGITANTLTLELHLPLAAINQIKNALIPQRMPPGGINP